LNTKPSLNSMQCTSSNHRAISIPPHPNSQSQSMFPGSVHRHWTPNPVTHNLSSPHPIHSHWDCFPLAFGEGATPSSSSLSPKLISRLGWYNSHPFSISLPPFHPFMNWSQSSWKYSFQQNTVLLIWSTALVSSSFSLPPVSPKSPFVFAECYQHFVFLFSTCNIWDVLLFEIEDHLTN